VNILDGKRDQWFRPSDVCVAPDGSLIVADWYDPGVGGHRMGDVEHGRLFRVTPEGVGGTYTAQNLDLSSAEGAIAALQNPNLATRYMGWTALKAMGPKAEPALTKLYRSDNPRHRARALWLLAKLGLPRPRQEQLLTAALHDHDVNIQVATVRLLRQVDREVLESVCDSIDSAKGLPVPVLREVLIGIRDVGDESDSGVWADVAQQYDGSDRWFLEALGIGASRHWDTYLAAYLESRGGNPRDKASRDIIWRSRSAQTSRLLGELIADPNTPESELPRLFRAFDFQPEASKESVILQLALSPPEGNASRVTLIQSEAIARLKDVDLAVKPEYKAAVERVLAASAGTEQFVRLVGKFNVADRYGELLALAQKNPEAQITIDAIRVLFDKQQRLAVRKALFGQSEELATATVTALATAADGRAVPLLLDVAADKERPLALRRAGVKALGSIRPGAVALQESAQKGDYDPLLKEAVAATLHTVQWRDIKEQAAKLFPLPPAKDSEPLPPVAELLERPGDVAKGRIVFHSTGTCTKCHVVNGLGQNVGPDLSEIGKKLSKPAFFESILYPSAAISHNYETWTVVDTNGNVTTGLLISETPDQIQLKDEKALVRTITIADIEERKKQEISLMPADIQKLMSAQELVDVVEYMTTLKQAQPVEKAGGN
jgi:putative heme-binding domain-containing protein